MPRDKIDMPLWLLKRHPDPLRVYDCLNGVVVVAADERTARALAASIAGDEGKLTWLDTEHSTSEMVGISTSPQRVILQNFRHG